MSKGTLAAVAAFGACLIFVLMLIRRAREGYEDKKGFHFGSTDKTVAPENQSESKVA